MAPFANYDNWDLGMYNQSQMLFDMRCDYLFIL